MYKWYFELEISTKKVTIAQDFWSLPGPDEENEIISYGLIENDYDIIHDLIEIKGTLVESSQTKKRLQSV